MEVTVRVPHVGRALKVRREALSLSQIDIADRLGSDQARVSAAEHNRQRPNVQRVQAAYDALLQELETGGGDAAS